MIRTGINAPPASVDVDVEIVGCSECISDCEGGTCVLVLCSGGGKEVPLLFGGVGVSVGDALVPESVVGFGTRAPLASVEIDVER